MPDNVATSQTFRLWTLGCKVNQYETQYVKEMLELNGYQEATPGTPADLCIVNTCTVTAEADAQGGQLIRRVAQTNPGSPLVIMGCFASRDPDRIRRLPGVTNIIEDKSLLAEELRSFGVNLLPQGISRFDGHQRAFVKVQEGCLLNCTYCIVPRVRPVLHSRPMEEIIGEVQNLEKQGYAEIVLTGVHLGHYGIDLSRGRPKTQWRRLWHLAEGLATLPGNCRLRLSSLEAAEVGGELLRVLAEQPRLCPHLHLSLQSGSDRILVAMKRRYTCAGFLARCRRIRELLDEPAFTTDLIVGFPGETEEDFEATCRVVREVGFCKLHLFPFSPRPGTPAASFPGQVSPSVVAERRRRLIELEKDLAAAYYRRLQGKCLDVLVEGPDPTHPGHVRGTSCRYVPVSFPGLLPTLLRRRVAVRIIGQDRGLLLGRMRDEG
jgi:threonylcarbamoyladenosine tRNA methylthiotransferase MtaB